MTATASLLTIALDALHESPLNPRRHFNEAKLQELAASISSHGILTPLLARPNGDGGWELAAGHRRYRASKLAGLEAVPVLVREMTDVEFVEVLTIENLQREDVHALEEAQGYADLMKHAGYDVARIAERVGRSVRYVYDRIKLLQLIPALQELFFNNEFTAAHAILLSRLSPVDQQRALDDTQALFTIDHGQRHRVAGEAPELGLTDRRKPMSVRELQMWIDQHVRFDVEAEHVPELFPETVAVVAPAVEQQEKVISITHNYHVDPGAKPEDGERTYTSSSWKRADGQQGSKTCERSVTGVIVVGPGRGEAFKVCTDRKKCRTHWAGEIREAAKKGTGSGSAEPSAQQLEYERQKARMLEQEKKDAAARAAYTKALPQIVAAIAAQVKTRATGASGPLGTVLVKASAHRASRSVASILTPGKSADDLVRYLAFIAITESAGWYNAYQTFPKQAKALGVDVAKIVAEVNGTAPPAKTAAKKTVKRFPVKKKAVRK